MASRSIASVVKRAAERKRFTEATTKARAEEAARHTKQDLPPVFNKRHFSKCDVIVTSEARRIMEKNTGMFLDDNPLTRSEISAMRCVVDGLKLIHNGVEYVKDCLAQCITFEKYDSFQYITKQLHEASLSCYYIIHGFVEVTYDFGISDSLQVFEPNIIYTHTSGEYLGLVRAEEGVQDISPPATVYTKEPCECLRVDRQKFHRLIARTRVRDVQEKLGYITDRRCVLGKLGEEERLKLIPKMLKVEFPPNKVIIKQGATDGEYVYFIISGRCQYYRKVTLPDSNKVIIFELEKIEEGAIFGEECVLDQGQPSLCSVVTSALTTCYKINKSEFEVKGSEHIIQLLVDHRHHPPSDEILRYYGHSESLWRSYREGQVMQVVAGETRNGNRETRWNGHKTEEDINDKKKLENYLTKKGKGQKPRTKSVPPSGSTDPNPLPTITRPNSAGLSKVQNEPELSPNGDDQPTQFKLMPKVLQNKSGHSKNFLRRVVEEYSKLHGLHLSQGQKKADHGPAEDSRDLLRRFRLAQNPEEARKAKWLFAAQTISYNYLMSNSRPVDIDTKAIIKRATESSQQYAKKVKEKREQQENTEDNWCTVLHQERETARTQMAFDKFRTEILRRRLNKQKERKDPTTFLKHVVNAGKSYEEKLQTTEEELEEEAKDKQTPKLTRRDTRMLFLRRIVRPRQGTKFDLNMTIGTSNPSSRRDRQSNGPNTPRMDLRATIGPSTPRFRGSQASSTTGSSASNTPRLLRTKTDAAFLNYTRSSKLRSPSPRKAKTPGPRFKTGHFDYSNIPPEEWLERHAGRRHAIVNSLYRTQSLLASIEREDTRE